MNLKQQIEAKKAERTAKLKEARAALDANDLDKSEELTAAVEAFDKAIAQLEKLHALSQDDAEAAKKATEDAAAEAGVRKAKRAGKVISDPNKKSEEVRNFIGFIQSKGESRSVTTTNAEAIIPKDIITKPQEQPNTVVDLREFANTVPVKTKSGSYPVLLATDAVMVSQTELEANPDLADPEFKEVDFKVETYRGAVPASEESLDDADGLEALIGKHVNAISLNTANKAISSVLSKAPAVAATSLDDVKSVFNTKLDPSYNPMFVATQSFLQLVDTLKDSTGRYILQQDITQPSSYFLFGHKMVVVKDNLLGKVGEAKSFVGDVSQYVLFADRKNITMKWADSRIYGSYLQAVLRFDVKVADDAAGYLVDLKLPTPPVAEKEVAEK